jgi:tRNA(Ile)-lysidine synthase
LNPEQLWQILSQQPSGSGFCVGYSGGRDSHVLLHLMASLRERLTVPLRALHVNHGLQEQAHAWAGHCRRVCTALDIPLTVLEVQCDLGSGASVEEAARDARYRAFEQSLAADEWLLLAHHQDDQAETVLLRLLRGAGVHGLAAMPLARRLGPGRLLRPLLDVPAGAIVEYADRQELSWIEDPSNRDPRFDRNFLRYQLLPQLAERWPGYQAPLVRAAEHAREAAELIDALAEMDLERCRSGSGLGLAAMRGLPAARQRNVLRLWLRRQGLRPPGQQRLQAGLQALLQAERDREPLLG